MTQRPVSTTQCVLCENDIVPGDTRLPTPEGTAHSVCAKAIDIRRSYYFSIGNPPSVDDVTWSLWRVLSEDEERPVLIKTEGLSVQLSTNRGFRGLGDVEMTEKFPLALAYAYHWLTCYRPMRGDRIEEEIKQEVKQYYPNGKVPDHEMWALKNLVTSLYKKHAVQSEIEPLVEICDRVTQWPVPHVIS